MQSLIRCELVRCKSATPEALSTESHVPIAEVLCHEILHKSPSTCEVVTIVSTIDLGNEGVEAGENPTIQLGAFSYWYRLTLPIEVIYVGIEGKKGISIV